MKIELKKYMSKPFVIWPVILGGALIYFLIGITHETLWYDEVYSFWMTRYNFHQIAAYTHAGPPLYYLLLKLFYLILGDSVWALRFLSVLGAVALVGLGAGPVRRACGDKTAYIYAILTVFTPIMLIMAHEVDRYTLLMFATTASALYGYLAARDNKTADWCLFGLFTLAAAYLHYFGLMVVSLINLILLGWILIKKRGRKKGYIVTAVTILILYLPWVYAVISQNANVTRASWIPPADFKLVFGGFFLPYGYKFFYPDVPRSTSIVLLLTMILIVYGIIVVSIRKDKKNLNIFILTFAVILGTFILAAIISKFLTPVFLPRYMLAFFGLILIALSLSVSLSENRYFITSTVAIYCLLNLFVIINVQTHQFNGPTDKIVSELEDEIQPGDLIITTEVIVMGPMLYYFPEADHFLYLHGPAVKRQYLCKFFEPDVTMDKQQLPALLARHKSFWLIELKESLQYYIEALPVDVGEIVGKEKWRQVMETKKYALPYSQFQFMLSKYTFGGGGIDQQFRDRMVKK